MTEQEYIDDIKLELTGGILTLELPDESLKKVLDITLQEVQRFIDVTRFLPIP